MTVRRLQPTWRFSRNERSGKLGAVHSRSASTHRMSGTGKSARAAPRMSITARIGVIITPRRPTPACRVLLVPDQSRSQAYAAHSAKGSWGGLD